MTNEYNFICFQLEDKYNNAFITTYGQNEYPVVPYDLIKIPSITQTLINKIHREMLS